MSLVGLPVFHGDFVLAVAPTQVLVNGLLLFGMTAVVGGLQGELLERREVALDAIEPRRLSRREVEANVVLRGPSANLGLEVRAVVVEHDVQDLLARVATANPLQERQELHPSLAARELTVETVGLEVVNRQEVTHTALALVRGAQTIDALAGSHVAMSVTRLQVQRAKLIDAQAPPVVRALAVQAANGPIFLPEERVRRFFPGFGAVQSDLATVQKLPQPL